MQITSLDTLLDLPVEGTCWATGVWSEPFRSLREMLARLAPFNPERAALHIDCAEYTGTIDHTLAVIVQLRRHSAYWKFRYPGDLRPMTACR